jgi:hypothetical protein
VIQAAIDNTSIDDITIPSAAAAPWQVTPLFIRTRSNIVITLEPGAVLEAKQGSFIGTNDCLLDIVNSTNITIRARDATLRMRRPYLPPVYKLAEWRTVVSIRGSSRISLDGGTLSDSGGDGVMVAGGYGTNFSTGVTLRGLTVTRAWRNGLSVISAKHLLVRVLQ